jgi:hypothetical protein
LIPSSLQGTLATAVPHVEVIPPYPSAVAELVNKLQVSGIKSLIADRISDSSAAVRVMLIIRFPHKR